MEEEIVKISILLEIYGNLLTEIQYISLNQYYNLDFSLSEIAQEQNKSRQAVRDNITKGKEKLYNLDKHLKLYDKFLKQNMIIENSIEMIEKIKLSDTEKLKHTLKSLKQNLSSLKNFN